MCKFNRDRHWVLQPCFASECWLLACFIKSKVWCDDPRVSSGVRHTGGICLAQTHLYLAAISLNNPLPQTHVTNMTETLRAGAFGLYRVCRAALKEQCVSVSVVSLTGRSTCLCHYQPTPGEKNLQWPEKNNMNSHSTVTATFLISKNTVTSQVLWVTCYKWRII